MYIQNIILNNIRGFGHLEFDLSRKDRSFAGWTVFTGNNGSGKSALLKAIAVALTGKDTARALQPSFARWIKEGASGDGASIQLDIVGCKGDDFFAEKGNTTQQSFPAKIALKNGAKETTLEVAAPTGKPKNYATPQRTIWSLDAKGWFSCGYGPFRRVFGASPEAVRQMVAPTTERFVTMFQEAASLAEVDQWLRNLKHKAFEEKSAAKDQLELLLGLLRDDLIPNQLTVDRVDSDGLWLKDRKGVQLAWPEMSDGYRAALALLSDILRHLIHAYGHEGLAEKDQEGRLFIKRSGVVLIDEVDAHLHPEWQRQIGFWLKRHFPKIQFLVTTHSPLICQAADSNGIFVLPEPGSDDSPSQLSDEAYQKIIVSRPDTILLTPAFGMHNTRSPKAVDSRAEWAKLQAKKRAGAHWTESERKKAEQLKLFALVDEEP
jgi:energy-coupling factor transporter ATP-binding protein EcfA2